MAVTSKKTDRKLTLKEARSKDALALAHLIYDCYQDAKVGANIGPGQNHAKKEKDKH